MRKGTKHSEEVRRKISEARTGHKHSEESRKKMSEAAKNRPSRSEETRRKMSEAKKGVRNWIYGKHHSVETRKKLSEFNKGKLHSEDTKQKIREANLNKIVSLETRRRISKVHRGKVITKEQRQRLREANLGKVASKETKQKMSLAQKGEKSASWRGGISFEPYGVDFNDAFKLLVRARDNYQCQICGVKETKTHHSVHHIDYDKKNNSMGNLITLCPSCHSKTNTNRDYWYCYFQGWQKSGFYTSVEERNV